MLQCALEIVTAKNGDEEGDFWFGRLKRMAHRFMQREEVTAVREVSRNFSQSESKLQ